MFNNKKDVLLESVKKVMQESELHRKLEAELNEAYGIVSRAALPHEYVAEYDAILAEAKKTGSLPRNEKEAQLAALTPPRTHVTHKDVLRGRGVIEEDDNKDAINHEKMIKYHNDMSDKHGEVGNNSDHFEASREHRRAVAFHQIASKSKDSNDIKAAARATARANAATKNAGGSLAKMKLLDEASLAAREKVLARSKMRSQKERGKLGPDASSLMGTKEGEAYTQASAREAGAERGVMRRMKPSFGKNVVKEEKATEAQKAKVAKVMHKWKQGKEHIGKSEKTVPVTKEGQKQAVAIALSQAGLSKKKRMDESLEAIHEEIRNTLWEKLDYVYENYGKEAAMEVYASLTEEERFILEQDNHTENEKDGYANEIVARGSRQDASLPNNPYAEVGRYHAHRGGLKSAMSPQGPSHGTEKAEVDGGVTGTQKAEVDATGPGMGRPATQPAHVDATDTKTMGAQAAAQAAHRAKYNQQEPTTGTGTPKPPVSAARPSSPSTGFGSDAARDIGAQADAPKPSQPQSNIPSARSTGPARPARPARPVPSSSGGSFGGQPSWAQNAFKGN